MALHARVSAALTTSFADAEQHLQFDLRQRALEAGWSREAADTVRVSHHNGGFKATAGRIADDFEFGTQDTPPLSVVRVFNAKQHQVADEAVASRLSSSLRGVL